MNAFYSILRNAVLISISVFVVFFVMNWGFSGTPWTWNKALEVFSYTAILSFVFYLGNGLAHDWIIKRLRIGWDKPVKRIGIGLSVVLFISILLSFLSYWALEILDGESFNAIYSSLSTPYFYTFFNRLLWISLTISVIFITIDFVQSRRQEKQVRQEVIIRSVTQTNAALKAQIGPHFLFNSLNVLSGLTEENPDKAQDFIADLSRVYRYVLEQSEKDLVSVAEEISFAENYLQLVKTRFENGLSYEIEKGLTQEENYLIPLSLQLLLENCIKHNRISTTDPLHLQIRKKGAYIEVCNNLNPKQKKPYSTGTGLKNIQEKYALLGPNKINIIEEDSHFCVQLPIVTHKIIHMENLNEQDYKEAKERVEELRGFYWHAFVFVAVNAFFVFMNLYNGGGYWFFWPLFGWGIGLFFHAVGVFSFFNVSKSWEERKIREILEKKQRERQELGKP